MNISEPHISLPDAEYNRIMRELRQAQEELRKCELIRDSLITERQQAQDERDEALCRMDEALAKQYNANAAYEAKIQDLAQETLRNSELRKQRQQVIDALREARPYVYNVAKDPANAGWRAETAEEILERVDAALVKLGEQP